MAGPAVLPLIPRYGESSLADLATSILASLGVPGEANPLDLASASRVCLLVIDGLGWELLRQHPAAAPFLSELARSGRPLTAGFPATTVTSLSSLGTGLPPGQHGMLGYQVAVPGTGRLLNALRWDKRVDPFTWQPASTVFERATAAGIAPLRIAQGSYRDSGLSSAVMRGAIYRPADTLGALAGVAAAALAEEPRALAMVYDAGLDSTGHVCGCTSDAWRFQLGHVDRLAEQLAGALPPGTAMYVTADHGMVDVGPADRVDADARPELRDGVALLGGEPRARHVYARPGAAARCAGHLAGHAGRGGLGGQPGAGHRRRLVRAGAGRPGRPDRRRGGRLGRPAGRGRGDRGAARDGPGRHARVAGPDRPACPVAHLWARIDHCLSTVAAGKPPRLSTEMGKLSTDKTSAARLLTGVADLAAALAAEHPPVVLDVRWRLGGPPGLDSYQAGHVPGAAFADLDQDLAAPAGSGGRHPLPETGVFQAAMRRAGISQASPVVVYDDGDSTVAARAWWLLRYFGHGRVRVLDGGFRAWTQAGQPVSTEVPQPRLGSFTARPGGMPLLSAAAAARLARSGVLLDARAAERYRGDTEPVDRVAGHIPGAVSAPTAENVGADGRFLHAAELRQRFVGPGRVRRLGRDGAPGGGVLRVGRDRGPRDPGHGAGRPARGPVRRVLVGLDRRPRPAGGDGRRAGLGPTALWVLG